MSFQSLFLVIGLAAVIGTLTSLRREHIRTEYSVSWLIVGVILLLLAVLPNALDRVANSFGLDSRLSFLTIAGALISGLVFEISHVVSKLRDENVLLTQRVAILEYQLRHNREGNGKGSQ
jgi:hypothetical protein